MDYEIDEEMTLKNGQPKKATGDFMKKVPTATCALRDI